MRGMILAAGRGSRMGALTDDTPKPLLQVQGRYLIEYAVEAFIRAGIKDIVVNIAWQGDQIRSVLGSGAQYGVRFYFSVESDALETGGGIFQALPLLGQAPFLVMSADIILQHPLAAMPLCPDEGAHILLVNNPPFHAQGDFSLRDGQVLPRGEHALTYANVGIFSPGFFTGCRPGRFPLGPLLHEAAARGKVTGELCQGRWWNIGTPALLQAAERDLQTT